ncbi:hypothetical protein DPMN_082831 [Dreissena polymorpha]|uniref:Glucose-methanol-choline oxidoreductase N-terminal domain-containing protein n=1 Tax=Dreissena polymorpha TaxID=45954 RepID=A0A9D3YBN9_DREPO|nr:hypothetical protein DPMN_082831 [Dreissena polymorpha]
MWAMSLKTEYDWEYYTEPEEKSSFGLKGGRSYWPTGRVLGGTSCTNGVQYTRGSSFDYDEWEANGRRLDVQGGAIRKCFHIS